MSEIEDREQTKRIEELEGDLRHKTLQWEGVKDMLAHKSSELTTLRAELAEARKRIGLSDEPCLTCLRAGGAHLYTPAQHAAETAKESSDDTNETSI
jgi:hypothetical protein